MNIEKNIKDKKYESELEYPCRSKMRDIMKEDIKNLEETFVGTITEHKQKAREITLFHENLHKQRMKEYRQDVSEKLDLFKKDLEEFFGTEGHPKADKLYSIAWEQGHSAGLYEVYYHYDKLSELVI